MTKLHIVGVSGGIGRPSRTTSLVNAILRELESLSGAPGRLFELCDVGPLLGAHMQRDELAAEGLSVLGAIESADIIVAGTPVYKGSYTGQFKHLFDLLDPNALVDAPVVLAATGGSDRHSLMIDHTLRPLFSFFRAHTVPTSLYANASQVDHDHIRDTGLRERIQVAARQALRLRGAPAQRYVIEPVAPPRPATLISHS
jgi:FMN reductase